MYKMLIADDEPIEIEGIKKIIEKNFEDITIVKEAKNGREVIEYFQGNSPDIAFLDIKMPGIDGISALKEIRKMNRKTKIVILSAYDDFQYAKESISLDAYEYLLKPVRRKKIIEVLENIIKNIKSERKEANKKVRLQEEIINIKSIVEEKLISFILEGGSEKIKEICTNENIFKINIDTAHLIGIRTDEKNREFVESKIKKSFKSKVNSIMSTYNDNIYILIEEEEADEYWIKKSLEKIERELKNNINEELIYWYEKNNYFEDIKKNVIKIIGKLNTINTNMDFNDENRLRICKEVLNFDLNYYNEFEKMLGYIMKKTNSRDLNFYEEINEIVSFLQYGAFMEKNEIYFKNSKEMIKNKRSKSSIKNAILVDLDTYVKLCRSNDLIENVKDYIVKNYDSKIKLEDLSYKFAISTFYLSKLFKQETGQNFIEFLTHIRIEKAKKMLKEGIQVKDVYRRVGYSDPNYFSRMFKKITGISPSKYVSKN
ncbi:response regulator transcription factor [Anaeromicrobium sediminis]|uniref:Stage 0 sporulation protein A homolog n=1 Tax=Anaeromicrobium sediminis TaxID=1478221 RepID=A0A267MKV0_9FIRM|nr:response regulator [Anaeromicrobium sediminis]PAB59515.1 hypothetical protein CCE28_09885 [Anaeromicrobium sediminis]